MHTLRLNSCSDVSADTNGSIDVALGLATGMSYPWRGRSQHC